MATTKTKIGDFEFENCFMNAAGVYCYDKNELEQVINSQAGTFVTKTATCLPNQTSNLSSMREQRERT